MTYTLSPALPAGVTRSATSTFAVSGTPSVKQASTEYTWTATDGDGDTASLTFDIAVDGVPTFGWQTISDKTWTQNKAIAAFTLPTASGGDGSLTYTLSPSLPDGVATTTLYAVSGTPTGYQAAASYTWKATDGDGDAAELTFTITIAEDLEPTFGAETIADQSWRQYDPITAFPLPKATGGDGELRYTLSPALPTGVVRGATTTPAVSAVSGTPSGALADAITEYTWTVEDADGDTASLTFDVEFDGVPSFGSQVIANRYLRKGVEITPFDLPDAFGGDGSLTYTLSPALPDDLVLGATSTPHRVNGTPANYGLKVRYTWTVEDGDGDTASLQFYIDVVADTLPDPRAKRKTPDANEPLDFPGTIDDKSWTQRQAITAFDLPLATGGRGSVTYTLSPALPAGVRLATTSDDRIEISGTPSGKMSRTRYTWSASDAENSMGTLFYITVDGVPTFGSETIADKSWTQRQAITAFTLPTATDGDGTLRYSISPALPAGVTLNLTTRQVSGTPSVKLASTEYTWTAEDADGDTASLTFDIAIDGVPSFSTTIGNKTWTQNKAITGFTLPTASGGDGSLTYTLSPSLPAGVTKNASHRVSGTPTGHQTATTYTWKAEDADGDTTQLTFTITIAEDLAPSFGSATISDKSWTQRQAITAFTLPTATGGDGSLTYTLSPALPAGVTKNAGHR